RERLLAVAPLLPASRGMPLDAVPVNLSRHWGVPAALGYTPLGLQRYGRLLPGAWPLHSGKVEELLALRYLLSPVRVRSAHGLEGAGRRAAGGGAPAAPTDRGLSGEGRVGPAVPRPRGGRVPRAARSGDRDRAAGPLARAVWAGVPSAIPHHGGRRHGADPPG